MTTGTSGRRPPRKLELGWFKSRRRNQRGNPEGRHATRARAVGIDLVTTNSVVATLEGTAVLLILGQRLVRRTP